MQRLTDLLDTFGLDSYLSVGDNLNLRNFLSISLYGWIPDYYSVIKDEQWLSIGIFLTLGSIFLYHYLTPSREWLMERALHDCWLELLQMLQASNSHPLLLRLAWSDAVSYDQKVLDWPYCQGCNGGIRFESALNESSNAGLSKAIDILTPLQRKYHRYISWSDLIQMGGVAAIYASDGPLIELNYGRLDVKIDFHEIGNKQDCIKQYYPAIYPHLIPSHLFVTINNNQFVNVLNSSNNQNLNNTNSTNTKTRTNSTATATNNNLSLAVTSSSASTVCAWVYPRHAPPYPHGVYTADMHIRQLTQRLGLTIRDMVALMGAHTLGRAFADRSGACTFSSGDQGASKYTKLTSLAKGDREMGVGMPGGCSWTKNWLVFDNSYYQRVTPDGILQQDSDLLWLPTDQALVQTPDMASYFYKYAEDINAFFKDYTQAHIKMSELGAKFQQGKIRIQFPNREIMKLKK